MALKSNSHYFNVCSDVEMVNHWYWCKRDDLLPNGINPLLCVTTSYLIPYSYKGQQLETGEQANLSMQPTALVKGTC